MVDYEKIMRVKRSSLLLFFSFVLFSFLAGFRWDVGTDWKNYIGMFDGMEWVSRIEMSAVIMTGWLRNNGFNDERFYIWIFAIVTNFFVCYSVSKTSINPTYSIILYFVLGFYFTSLNIMRQWMAMSLFLFSWQFIIVRDFKKYIYCILLAFAIHTSAVILFPVYFLRLRLSPKLLMFGILVAIGLSFSAEKVIVGIANIIPKYQLYATGVYAEQSNILSLLRALFPLSIIVISLIYYNKIANCFASRFFFNLTYISLILLLGFPGFPIMVRVADYFQISLLIFLPILAKLINNYRNRMVFVTYTIVYGLAYVYVTMYLRGGGEIFPFHLRFDINLGRLMCLIAILLVICFFIIYFLNTHKDVRQLYEVRE